MRSSGAGGCRSGCFATINGRFIGEGASRNFNDSLSFFLDSHESITSDHADLRIGQVPLFENLFDPDFLTFFHDDQHALLGFAQKDLVGRHSGFPLRHEREIDFHAGPATAGSLTGRTSQTGSAHVLDASDAAAREQFQAGFEQQLFAEGIPDLDCWTVFFRFFGQVARGKRSSSQPVASGLRPNIKDGISNSRRGAAGDLAVAQYSKAKYIHQRIAGIGFVKINLAADRWDPDTVSVMGDAGDDACKKVAVGTLCERTKTQRIQTEDGPCTHRKDVANDAAYPGSGSLERLDGAGMVVTFHFECHRPIIADIDHAGILLSGRHQYSLAAGGKFS